MKGNIDVQIDCGHLIVIVTGMYVSTKNHRDKRHDDAQIDCRYIIAIFQ